MRSRRCSSSPHRVTSYAEAFEQGDKRWRHATTTWGQAQQSEDIVTKMRHDIMREVYKNHGWKSSPNQGGWWSDEVHQKTGAPKTSVTIRVERLQYWHCEHECAPYPSCACWRFEASAGLAVNLNSLADLISTHKLKNSRPIQQIA